MPVYYAGKAYCTHYFEMRQYPAFCCRYSSYENELYPDDLPAFDQACTDSRWDI
jgi:hypothetical protein